MIIRKNWKHLKAFLKDVDNLEIGLEEEDFVDKKWDEVEEIVTEFIYEFIQSGNFNNSIKYLMENDPSLTISISLLEGYNREVFNITSELLATYLMQDVVEQKWEVIKNKYNLN